jgi:hypothetical protein
MSKNPTKNLTNLNLIDPNNEILGQGTPWYDKTNGIPRFENIRSFVELFMRPKNANFIELQNSKLTSASSPKDATYIKLGGYYVDNKNNSYYSTNYTDEIMGGNNDVNKSYEGFGIKSIEITFDPNKIPQVTIVFYDVRGNVLNDFNSKFANMFQVPYPIFELRIKGGFGPLVSYRLLKIRDDISVDELGNYIITSKLIGDRFSPFGDLPLNYLLPVPYLKGTTVNVTDNDIKSFHELIISSKRLYISIQSVAESPEEQKNQQEIQKLTDDKTNLETAKSQIRDINVVKSFFLESDKIKGKFGPAFIDEVIKFVESGYVNETFGDYITAPLTSLSKDAHQLVIDVFKDLVKTLDDAIGGAGLIKVVTYNRNVNGADIDVISNIDYSKLTPEISKVQDQILDKAAEFSRNKAAKLSTAIDSTVGGSSTLAIGNVFRLMIDDYNYIIKEIWTAGNKGYKDKVTAGGSRNGILQLDRMGYPTVINNGIIVYPGEIDAYKKWPEIQLIERFINAYAKAIRDSVTVDILASSNEDGSSRYIPINPVEIYKNGSKLDNTQIQNVYNNKTADEIFKLIYNRFLCLININTNYTKSGAIPIDKAKYSTWNTPTTEEDSHKASILNIFTLGLTTFDVDAYRKGLFLAQTSAEARNLAYAVSLSEPLKTLIKGLATVTIDPAYIAANTTPSITNSIKNPTNPLLIPESFGPFDSLYVTLYDEPPSLITEGTQPPDIISQYMRSIDLVSKASTKYVVTKENILYLKDETLDIENGVSTYNFKWTHITTDGASNNDIIFEFDTELAKYSSGFPDSLFDFDKLKSNCGYRSLVEVPKGMLMIMGAIAKRTKELSIYNAPSQNFYYINPFYGDLVRPTGGFFILRNSEFERYILDLWEDAKNNEASKGFAYYVELITAKDNTILNGDLVLTENNLRNIRIRLTSTSKKSTPQERQAIIKYIYEPVYLSINDYRFLYPDFKGTSSNLINEEITLNDTDGGLYSQYLNVLLKKAAEFIKADTKAIDDKVKEFSSYIRDKQVKLAIYRSFQTIYENYLHGVDEKDLAFNLSESFAFVDRGYNDISTQAIIDVKTLVNDVNDYEVSMFSSIARLLANNNFWFYPFQSFLTTADAYKNLFNINYDVETPTKPYFVAMYVGALSSNPDGPETSLLKNDGIVKNAIPEDFTRKGPLSAFLVKYTGTQNQAVFSNLQVSTESLKNTDEGLRIQSEIITNSSNNYAIPKGQSLLNIYQRQSYTSTVKIPYGNMGIQPTQYYYQEYMPLFDGLYIVYNVSHSIDADTQRLETTFKGYRLKKDTLPIVTTPIVDFISDDIYTAAINTNLRVQITSGPMLDPLKNLIASAESFGGDYGAYNTARNYVAGQDFKLVKSWKSSDPSAIKLTTKTVGEINNKLQKNDGAGAGLRMWATGKYQVIPDTLRDAINSLGLNSSTLYDANTQEKIGDYLLLVSRTKIAAYLKGNTGTFADLEAAVLDVAQCFASMPAVIKTKFTTLSKAQGDVQTGVGNAGYYGGDGTNPSVTKVIVKSVVIAIITSRLQYCGIKPKDMPSYYSEPPGLVYGGSGGSVAASTGAGSTPSSTAASSTSATDIEVVTVGDSLSVGLSTVKNNIIKITSPVTLSLASKRSQWLIDELKKVSKPFVGTNKVFLSMGANEGYQIDTGKANLLIGQLKRVFPSANFYILNGSYGWDGLKVTSTKDETYWENSIKTYTNHFVSAGFTIVGSIIKQPNHPAPKKSDPFFVPILNDIKAYGV